MLRRRHRWGGSAAQEELVTGSHGVRALTSGDSRCSQALKGWGTDTPDRGTQGNSGSRGDTGAQQDTAQG